MTDKSNFDPADDYFFDDEPDDEDDELELLIEQCGSRRHRQCDLLGTEWCDWMCPLHNEVFSQRKSRKS